MQENKEEKQPVLALYDVRGIQDYVFRTNKLKEIIGASQIIKEILRTALREATKSIRNSSETKDILNWESEKWQDMREHPEIRTQVVYIGGGNACVAYRNRETCVEINKIMSKYILEKTYSLQLAIAIADMSESYVEDDRNLQKKMLQVKAEMPFSQRIGAFPIVSQDSLTGFPITQKENNTQFCQESWLKREAFGEIDVDEKSKDAKILDNMVTEKYIESILAVVHIDGNNMGNRIQALMRKEEMSYTESVERMRKISKNINVTFENAYVDMKNSLYEWVGKKQIKELDESGTYLRDVIIGGDDITFVCNAKVALQLVEQFTKKVNQGVLFGDSADKENLKINGFSVCAGIAYMNSHFPFRVAYDVAEECCRSAKKRAKEEENKDGDIIGNFVDFQICKNMQTADLEYSREKDYYLPDGSWLLRRPYYLTMPKIQKELNEKNEKYNFEQFKQIHKHFFNPRRKKTDSKIPISMARDFRNTYPLGEGAMDALIQFAQSRGKEMPKDYEQSFIEDKEYPKVAQWYDALEMLDFYREVKSDE